jgi:7-carboxy-7-deazaguanine synthase
LSGCNLKCGFKYLSNPTERSEGSSWICDSIERWKTGTTYSIEDFLSLLNDTFDLQQILGIGKAHIVFTGGEPLLQQSAIVKFLKLLDSGFSLRPYIEVETNGTIMPTEDMKELVNWWNVSPKLSNSGESSKRRLKSDVLSFLAGLSNSNLKVVVTQAKDIDELKSDLWASYDFSVDRIWLMPGGESKEEIDKVCQLVVEACKSSGFRYTDRLQIRIWNEALGV